MPIRIVDRPSRLGRIAASLNGVSAELDGTHVAPASVSGVIMAQLGALTGELEGLFTPKVTRTGVIGSSLDGVSGVLSGTFSPAGAIINVSNVTQLMNAVNVVNSAGGNRTIVLANGTYTIPDALYINVPNVTLRSASGNRANVIIQGDAISASANVPFNVRVAASGFTALDLTFGGRCRYSAIQVVGESGAHDGRIANCIVRDSYEHLLKSSAAGSAGAQEWVIEDCLFTFTAGQAPAQYNGGIDVHRGTGWIVRRNRFTNIASPSNSACQHAVNFWNGSQNNLIERNIVIDCDRGIGSGLAGNPANSGDIIRNNTAYHSANTHQFADVQISVENSLNCRVYNNTVYVANSFPWAMEYRFTTTGAEFRNNLTNKPIQSRDGGTATLSNNVTNAQASWFVSVSTGDLRLASDVNGVVNAGATLALVPDDLVGTSRPQGPAYDIGAHERIQSQNPTTLPRLQLSNISYLGFFNLPQQAGGSGDAFTMQYGGGGLAVGPNNTLYVAGHLHQGKIARFNIPSIGGTATVATNLTTVPGTFSTTQNTIGGALVWNNRLIISKFGNYENPGQFRGSHTSCNLNLTGFTNVQSTSYQRMAAGFMGVIPPEWRELFGGPCFMGSGPRSIDNNQCSLGPAFFVFDPVEVDGSGTIPVRQLLAYDLAHQQQIWPGHNFLETNGVGGAAFVPGTRTILFWGHAGAGNPKYMQPISGDPCRNGNSGFSDYPYHLAIWAYDANDLLAVKNGQKQVWEPVPYSSGASYNSWQTPGYGTSPCSSIGLFNTSTACFDPETLRVYMCEDYGTQPRVHVWQITVPSS